MSQPTGKNAAMGAVIQLLLECGFSPDGYTREQAVLIPTKESPLFGKSGGELAKFGGRQRFVKEGTNIKVTVGPKTTAIYRVEGKGLQGIMGIATADTREIDVIRAALAKLVLDS